MNLIPNIPATAFSGSAVVVGYLLIEDLTANEQNALGNWLMLAAQVLCTNAFYQQVQQERQSASSNSQSRGKSENATDNLQGEIAILKKMVEVLNKEIKDLESKI